MNKSESIVELSKAMANFQAEVKQPLKDKNNPFFKSKYVPLESVVESITESAPKHGLSFTQWAQNDAQGRIGVATLLMHSSGEYIEYDPVFMNADKNTAQGAGALITYLKRYSLSAIFGITSDEDDDGNAASGNKQQVKQTPISQEKVGELKTAVISFAKDYGADEKSVLENLNIRDYTKLTMQAADEAIKTLNNWRNQS
ncbi:ERF family protein [Macrococcus bovicus]|uniref:Single-stranded DNA-binding protein n=1 Tax=Macrococcus bovicus TaxID=69968 RepID=A0A4R6BWF6_9STAP|nr:ERF family protein [Macrococcus bovicus]TDM12689.1 single-stranded DNA-binding protein [Macrococcus bovicus]